MAEEEYERMQSFFYKPKPIIMESKATVAVEPTRSCLQDELALLKLKDEEEKKETLCDVCGGKYSYFNKNRHFLTKKHLSARPSPPPLE
jgi:hypothetical protein